MGEKIRLNKYISETGYSSRRKADELIAAGKITVNGNPADMGMRVGDDDKVMIDSNVIKRDNPFKLVAFNKPKGYACTSHHGDESGIFKNFDLSADLKYIGRLDKDSEGLLLLTNDGDLCNEISKARNQHEKEYVVTVNRTITDDFLKGMAGGVKIHDSNKDMWVVTKKCKVKKRNDKSFSIILTQGYNRQIRKMCEVFEYKVVKLRRIRVINIEIGDLESGKTREITEEELSELKRRIAQDTEKTDATKNLSWDVYLGQFDVVRLVMTRFFKKNTSVSEALTGLLKLVIRDYKKAYPEVDYFDDGDLVQTIDDVYSTTKEKVVFVIDEWDAVFRTLRNDSEGQTEYLDFLRDLFKDNKHVALAYMTGILPIKKYGEHSALNMFDEYSMVQPMRLAEYTGFTEAEVKELCDEYEMSFDEVSKWYVHIQWKR